MRSREKRLPQEVLGEHLEGFSKMRIATLRFAWLAGVLAAIVSASSTAGAFYEARDAQYVSTSPNPAVIRYIICLEDAVGSTARNVAIADALAGAEKSCERWALRLPNTPGEPNAGDIRQSILHCGFRPGDASPDAGCGKAAGAGNVDRASANPDQVVIAPEIIEVGKWAEGLAWDGRSLWVAESGQRTVARIDLAARRVVDRAKVGRLPTDMVATAGGDVDVLVATDKLVWKRSANGGSATLTKLDECPQAMIGGAQALWVLTLPDCSSDKSRLIRVDRGNGRQSRTDELGQWGQAMTAQGNQIWIAHARGPALTVADQDTLDATSIKVSGASLWSLAANSRNVFGGGREDENNEAGLVVMFDPVNRTEVHRATMSQLVTRIVSDENHVVALGNKGTIWVFAARDLSLQRTITLSTGAFEPHGAIFHQDSILISVGQFSGENGAVFVVGDWRPGQRQSNLPATEPVAPAPGQRIWPSFDCAAANSAAERVICANSQLASLDRALDAGYGMALSNITSAAVGGTAADVLAFKKEQRAWLRQRDDCRGDENCLFAAYQSRLRVLDKMNQPE